jgi:hypothetical protein
VNASTQFTRGAEELRRLLTEQTFDLRKLDLAGFCQWVQHHLQRWQDDPVFAQRAKIRQLRQAHPEIRRKERERQRLADTNAGSEQFLRLEWVERELVNTNKAIAGLTQALQQASPEKHAGLLQKRMAFERQRQLLENEHGELLEASPERRRLRQLDNELQQLHSATGLEQSESHLRNLVSERGRRSGHRGERFEDAAAGVAERLIAAELTSSGADDVHVLRGVTFGAAKLEIDLLVVQRPHLADQPVDVLAVVETKRNINDIGLGFRRWQANLAWLTGEVGSYDPQAHRTRRFPTGHFDRQTFHEHAGELLRFAPGSFHRFERESKRKLFLDRLYFITRAGPLWGISSGTLARIAHRLATGPAWETADEVYRRSLMQWAQSLADAIESPDVLRLYAARQQQASQVLLATPPLQDES